MKNKFCRISIFISLIAFIFHLDLFAAATLSWYQNPPAAVTAVPYNSGSIFIEVSGVQIGCYHQCAKLYAVPLGQNVTAEDLFNYYSPIAAEHYEQNKNVYFLASFPTCEKHKFVVVSTCGNYSYGFDGCYTRYPLIIEGSVAEAWPTCFGTQPPTNTPTITPTYTHTFTPTPTPTLAALIVNVSEDFPYLHQSIGAQVSIAGPSATSDVTDSSGLVRFDNLVPGAYVITVTKTCFNTVVKYINLWYEVREEDIALTAQEAIYRGRVGDNNGQPIAHAMISYVRDNVIDKVVWTDQFGNYELRILGGAAGLIIASYDDIDIRYRKAQTSVFPSCTQTNIIDFILQKEVNMADNDEDNPKKGDPVDPLTGKITNSVTDLKLMGRHGFNLEIKRNYRGENWWRDGIMGKGWTLNLDSYILFTGTSQPTFKDLNGQFHLMSGSGYSLPQFLNYNVTYGGYYFRIHKLSEKKYYTYIRSASNASKYLLSEIVDEILSANKITFNYNSSGILDSVTDSVGRILSIQYDGQKVKRIVNNGVVLREYGYTVSGANNDSYLSSVDGKAGPYIWCTYNYDNLGRLTRKYETNAGEGNLEVIYMYDSYNRVKMLTTGTEELQFNYMEYKNGSYTGESRVDPNNTVKPDLVRPINVTAGTDAPYKTIITNSKNIYRNENHYFGGAGSLVRQDVNGSNKNIAVDTNSLKPLTVTDEYGATSYYLYDSRQNLTWVKKPVTLDGNAINGPKTDCITVYAYNNYGYYDMVMTEQEPEGGLTVYTRDGIGRVMTVNKNAGTANTYENLNVSYYYMSDDKWTETTKINFGTDHVKTCEWIYTDPYNIIYRETIGARNFETIYDRYGRVVAKDTSIGRETYTYFDGPTLVVKLNRPGRNDVTYNYDIGGFLVSETDANNHTTSYSYDIYKGKLTSKSVNVTKPSPPAPSPVYTSYSYYPDGTLQNVDDGVSAISYTYDNKGKINTINTDGRLVTYNYSYSNGIETKVVYGPAYSNITTYYTNEQGNLLKVEYANGSSVKYTYDKNGNQLSVSDQRNNVVSYVYDKLNRIKQINYPGGVQDNYSYDGRNNKILENGYYYIYDNFDRLDYISDCGQNCNIIQDLNYCSCGSLSEETILNNLNAKIIYEYTAEGWLEKTTYPDGTYIFNTFDNVGNILTTKIDGTTDIATYEYDEANRLFRINGNVVITRNSEGNVLKYEYPNGISMKYNYGNTHAVKEALGVQTASNTNITRFEIPDVGGRDNAGNVKIKNVITGRIDYSYDLISQLTNYQNNGANTNITYNYDASGNRMSVITDGVPETYSPKTVNDEYSAVKGTSVTYLNGCMTSYLGKTLSWDFKNRLTNVSVSGGRNVAYKYRFDDLRIEKIVDGSAITKYYYNGNKLVAEKDTNGLKKIYVNDGDSVVGFARKVNMPQSWQYFYYLFDDLGSVAAVTNDAGQPVQFYLYDPYGNITNMDTDNVNNLSFIGKYGGYMDWDTGLVYFWHRWYDPEIGRWTSRDPIGIMGGVNIYNYVENNPINLFDVNGFCKKIVLDYDCAANCIFSGINKISDKMLKNQLTGMAFAYIGCLAPAAADSYLMGPEVFGPTYFGCTDLVLWVEGKISNIQNVNIVKTQLKEVEKCVNARCYKQAWELKR